MNRIYSLIAGSLLFWSTSTASASLVSHWRGQDNPSDSVGTNHGTAIGVVNYVPGVVGNAFRFPDNGYIHIFNPAAGGLVSPAGFSFTAWVRLDGADPPPSGGPGAIVRYGTASNTNGFFIQQSGFGAGASPIAFGVFTGDPNSPLGLVSSQFPNWSLGQIYHLAATFDAATHTMALYRDGELEERRTDVPGNTMVTDAAAQFRIGSDIGSGAAFDGMLDEARFYNHALTQAEVQAQIPEPAALTAILALSVPLRRRR